MLNLPDKRLAQQAYEEVLDLILSGRVQPGDLLNERSLATMLAMSRTPVRDALLMLEGEGLLVRHGRRGLQVRQMRLDDFMDALQIRLLLEPEVARMAAGAVPDSPLDEIASRLEALMAAAGGTRSEIDREEVRSVDERLHALLADTAGNPQLAAIIRNLRRQTQIFDLKSLPERLTDTCREHLDIVRAVREGRKAEAASAMSRHLEAVRGSIVTRLSRP